MSIKSLRVSIPGRVHMSLIDLGLTGYRRNGGVGFCVDAPHVQLEFELASSLDLSLLETIGFESDEIAALVARLRASSSAGAAQIGLRLANIMAPSRHVGIGVGTSIALGCTEAFSLFNACDYGQADLIRISGRGGTSGIGVHGYFSGGFIFDVGRRFDALPIHSSDDIAEPAAIPLAISKTQMPNWQVGLFSPPGAKAVSIELERHLFSSTLPLKPEEVHEITYHAVFGAVAAVHDHDFDGFCASVNAIQKCTWKKCEIDLHGDSMRRYIVRLQELGCSAVGMSSVGPTLYFFSRDFPETVERIRKDMPLANVSVTTPNNSGRKICYA